MYVSLMELFKHRQYVSFPTSCYFDRKTYTFIDTQSPPEQDVSYDRFIPLFQIDQDGLKNRFLYDLNDKCISSKWRDFEFCFEEFCQQNHLWNRWWDYYMSAVNQIAIHWCEENNIKYRGENDIENQ